MVELLQDINRRTQLVGENRFELLLFSLDQRHRFGINVFKVREVIPCPPLRRHPSAHRFIAGVAHVRGRTIPVISLMSVFSRQPPNQVQAPYLIVTEFNRRVQGFLARSVDRIVNLNWQDVQPPLEQSDKAGYITAIAEVDDKLIEVVDVEKVLTEIVGQHADVSADLKIELGQSEAAGSGATVMVVDDSQVARSQIQRALEQVGLECILMNDGQAALELLERRAADGTLDQAVQMVISDIEMPRMDGYTLTSAIRRDQRLAHLQIMLHSSLSGGFNQAMVDKVGANYWLPKFASDELAKKVIEILSGIGHTGLAEAV